MPTTATTQAVAHWLERWHQSTCCPDTHAEPEEHIVYLLSRQGACLALRWAVARRAQRGGGWNKPRKLPQHAHDDFPGLQAGQADWDCVRMIEVLSGPHSAYSYPGAQPCLSDHWPSALGTYLLQKCAATGRLHWCDAQGRIARDALSWGPPRTLQWTWRPMPPSVVCPSATLWKLHAGTDTAEIFLGIVPWYVDGTSCGRVQMSAELNAAALQLLWNAPPFPEDAFTQMPALLSCLALAHTGLPPTVKPPPRGSEPPPNPPPNPPPHSPLDLDLDLDLDPDLKLEICVLESGGWFDLSLGILIDGQRQNVLPWLPRWLSQAQEGPQGLEFPEWLHVESRDGRLLRLASAPLQPWLQLLLTLPQERAQEGAGGGGSVLRLSRFEMLSCLSMGAGATCSGTASLERPLAMLRQLQSPQSLSQRSPSPIGTLPDVAPPVGLHTQLRPYQQQGVNWLQFLRCHQLGGVLADEMGLGKTVQTLAHLLIEKEAGRMDRPCLIVAPVSLLGNWQREAQRFAPSLRTYVWHGNNRHAGDAVQGGDLWIAPYSLLQRERERWLGQSWHIVVLDEAQHIKNAHTHAAQVVAQLQARQRVALSGTPLENHLGELWSLFHFLMPGFLGSMGQFQRLFRTPIEKQGRSDVLERLRQRVTPFILRRTKTAVATQLPPCTESITPIELGSAQADFYETLRLSTEKTVREALADKGLERAQIEILDALLKLRQVCCDPRLVKHAAPSAPAPSAKLEQLMEMLPELLAEGRRVLLFSQFTSMLTLIEEQLRPLGIAWTKLTGKTLQRDRAIERFTGGEVPLFLISLKAGGTGLNLVQADTVIHYDPWWNPAAQAQATARAHRIGQEQPVTVYKLVAQGTIEERILALQERKAALVQEILSGASARAQPLWTQDDLLQLLRPLGDEGEAAGDE